MNERFVPVALKAALMNNPGDDEEGRLYREIGRSKAAPQGICVVNSAGKVLEWALMFDDDAGVVGFLDHGLERYAADPDAKHAVVAERYMKFPSNRLRDVEDDRRVPVIPEGHGGKPCPAKPRHPAGTLAAQLFGRALGADGKPFGDTTRQEYYVEDRFYIAPRLQESFSRAVAEARHEPVMVPDGLARLLVSYAYLGHLDVRPVDGPGGNSCDLKRCALVARRMPSGAHRPGKANSTTWRIDGESDVSGVVASSGQGLHDVTLTWTGFIETDGTRITRLALAAQGTEKLQYGHAGQRPGKGPATPDVANLPGGHPIDLDCGVRYGILAEPARDGD